MTPEPLTQMQWEMLFSALLSITYFVGFVILGSLSFLLGYAVIPSVLYAPLDFARLRYERVGLYAIGAIAFVVATYQMARAIGLIAAVVGEIYPRWWI